MKKIFFLLMISNFTIILLNSCNPDSFDQVVTFDFPKETPKIVCSASFVDSDTSLNLFLSASTGINDAPNKLYLDKANVKLYKDNVLLADFKENEPYFGGDGNISIYHYDLKQNLGDGTYKLSVSNPPYLPVEATAKMPQKVAIKSATFVEDGFVEAGGDKLDEFTVEFIDPVGNNFYTLQLIYELKDPQGNLYYTSPYRIKSSTSAGGLFDEDERNVYFTDGTFEGQTTKLRFGTRGSYLFFQDPKTGQQVKGKLLSIDVRLISMTKDGYSYQKSLDQYLNSEGNPFSEPSQVNTNFANGFGIFQLSRASSFKIKF
jgi:hypothetical protein